MTTERYQYLVSIVLENTEECGIALDLNHPADRAILDECGLTRAEALEFLGLWDTINDAVEDDTVRVQTEAI